MGFIARAVLLVLAEAADIGLPEAVAVPIAAHDPFLRSAIRREVARALHRAEERTLRRGEGDHLLRVAFVLAHPEAPTELDANDHGAVAAAFERLAAPLAPHLVAARGARAKAAAYRQAAPDRQVEAAPEAPAPKRPTVRWPVTTPLAAAGALGAVGVALVLALPYVVPTKLERFRATPFGRALGGSLTEAIVHPQPGRATDELLSPAVAKQIGGPAQAELDRLLGAIAPAQATMAPVDEAMAPVFDALNALDARLEEANVPAFLHGYAQGRVGSRSVWITSYFVERRSELTFEGTTTKTVWGRRLDSLNLSDATAYKARAEERVIVSLDVVEATFAEVVLPLLVTPPSAEATYQGALGAAAAKPVARELLEESRVTADDAATLSTSLAQRNHALERAGLKPRHELTLGPAACEGGAGRLSASDVRSLDASVDRARRKVAPAIFRFAELVEEGFVVRLCDEQRFEAVVFPRLGPQDASPTTRARTSSQLGLLARSATPHLALWLLARDALGLGAPADRGLGRAVVRLVGKQLGVDVVAHTDQAYLEAARAGLVADTPALRAAAARAYEEGFVAPVPPLARRVW